MAATIRSPGRLLLKNYRRPADSLPLEVDGYFDAVGDLDERYAAVHPIVLAFERHCPFNGACACPLIGNRKQQLLGFSRSAMVESPSTSIVSGLIRTDFVE